MTSSDNEKLTPSRALQKLRSLHENAAIAFARDLFRKEQCRKDFTVYRPSYEEDTARIAWELKSRDRTTLPASTTNYSRSQSAPIPSTSTQHTTSSPASNPAHSLPNSSPPDTHPTQASTAITTSSSGFVFRPLYPKAPGNLSSDWSPQFKDLYYQAIARLRGYLDLAADTVYNDLSRDLNYRVLQYVEGVPGALRQELGLHDVNEDVRERAKRLCEANRDTAAKRRKLARECAELDELEKVLEGCV